MSVQYRASLSENPSRFDQEASEMIDIIAEQAIGFGNLLRERNEDILSPSDALLIFASHLAVLSREFRLDSPEDLRSEFIPAQLSIADNDDQ